MPGGYLTTREEIEAFARRTGLTKFTPEQMEELVNWVKYAPEGVRGLAMGANAGYDGSDVARYCREANEALLVLPKIESPLGVKNAGAMLDVEGVDGAVFGPGDLSAKMGYPGEWEAPDVLAAINIVVDAAIARGKAVEPPINRQGRLQPRTHPWRPHLRTHQADRIRPAQRRIPERLNGIQVGRCYNAKPSTSATIRPIISSTPIAPKFSPDRVRSAAESASISRSPTTSM